MHRMAFVYDLVLRSKNEKKIITCCVFIYNHFLSLSVCLSLALAIYLATWNHKSKQSTERRRTKKNSSVISRTRTANKNDMLVLRLYHFHSIFENFNFFRMRNVCLLFIEYFVYNTQYSFRFINDTKKKKYKSTVN